MLPTTENIWKWVLEHWRDFDSVQSPGGRSVYNNIRLAIGNTAIVYTRNEKIKVLSKERFQSIASTILRDGWLRTSSGHTTQATNSNIDYSDVTISMLALGWKSTNSLVYNDTNTTDTAFYLRYIPVDFALFDCVFAELSLQRQTSTDPNTAKYKASDWKFTPTLSDWFVSVTKDNTEFQIHVHENEHCTTIHCNIESQVISWPEKILVEDTLRTQLQEKLVSWEKPKIWWASFLGANEKSYNNQSIQSTRPFVGVDCGILNKDWKKIDVNSPQVSNLASIQTTYTSTYIPFLLYIRPHDLCFNASSKKCYGYFAEASSDIFTWQQECSNKSAHNHIFRPIQKWIFSEEKEIFSNIQQDIETTLPVSRQIVYGLGALKQKWDQTQINFTDGMASTEEYAVLYKEFIEQRAQVLDPTSRSLLVYLKERTQDASVVLPTVQISKLSPLLQTAYITKNVILEGVPGTGKTFAFNHTIVDKWKTEIEREPIAHAITMHPSTSYEDFMEGLRPSIELPVDQSPATHTIQLKTTSAGSLSREKEGWFYHPPKSSASNFSITDGFFLSVCKEAVFHPDKDYLVLLDEINRCNIPSVLGDLLTALERSKRALWVNSTQNATGYWDVSKAQIITLATSKRKFFVPDNVYVVGTMNTTDRSVAPMDMAVRRRFSFYRLHPTPLTLDIHSDNPFLYHSNALLCDINKQLASHGPDAQLGFSYVYDMQSDMVQYGTEGEEILFLHHWNHNILPQLAEILFTKHIPNSTYTPIQIKGKTYQIQRYARDINTTAQRPELRMSAIES